MFRDAPKGASPDISDNVPPPEPKGASLKKPDYRFPQKLYGLSLQSRCVFIFLIIYFSVPLSAQKIKDTSSDIPVDSILVHRGEAYIAISLSRYKSALSLLENFNIDRVYNDTVYLYLTAKDTGILYSTGINFSLLTAPSLRAEVKMAASIPEVLEGKAYPTWSQYLEIMRSFKEAYPDILTIDTIGYSINNKLILAARIQTGNMPIINRPLVFLSAAIHGDEPPGYVMLIMLINELLEDYFGYGNFTDLLDQIVLIINPLANPDGTYFADDNTVYGSKRTNLNNIDLNRNFPDIYAGSFPYGYPRQKENQVMIDYMDRFPPSLSANIHTGAEVVNYPWDWRENPDPADRSPNLHPDDKWFRFISSEYADSARAGNPGYMSSFPGGITNGAAWYVIYGGRQDYVTAFLGGRELTLEISDEKIPPASEIELYYNRNNRSLINFIRQATYGVHGFVTDALTGEPLEAKINIRGHDSQYSCIYSDSTSGAFHRYLKAGKYKAVFEKRSYSVKSLEINISDYSRIDLEVKLSPLSEINCWPNPFSGEFRASFNSGTAGQCKAELFNLTGQLIHILHYSAVEGENIIVFKNIPPGMYILRITTPDTKFSCRVIGV